MSSNDYVMVPVHLSKLSAVFALLAGAAPVAVATGNVVAAVTPAMEPSPSVETAGTVATPVAATSSAPESDPNDLDAGGWPWSADLHASTKSKTKEGYWRMKVGVSRPENKPGFEVAAAPATAPSTAPAPAEDDEFAAFRAAAAATPAPAPVARSWTDADLSKLCNQAAIAAGGPDTVKAIIAKYVPEGTPVPHSRLISADRREAFAVEVEQTVGIVYEG